MAREHDGHDNQTAQALLERGRQAPGHAVRRWQSSGAARSLRDARGVAGPPRRARRPLEAHRSVAECALIPHVLASSDARTVLFGQSSRSHGVLGGRVKNLCGIVD